MQRGWMVQALERVNRLSRHATIRSVTPKVSGLKPWLRVPFSGSGTSEKEMGACGDQFEDTIPSIVYRQAVSKRAEM